MSKSLAPEQIELLEQDLMSELRRLGRSMGVSERGTYGVCVECGGHVSYGRLSVFPESGECSGCAS